MFVTIQFPYTSKTQNMLIVKVCVVYVDALGNLAIEILDKALIRVFKSVLQFLNI